MRKFIIKLMYDTGCVQKPLKAKNILNEH